MHFVSNFQFNNIFYEILNYTIIILDYKMLELIDKVLITMLILLTVTFLTVPCFNFAISASTWAFNDFCSNLRRSIS